MQTCPLPSSLTFIPIPRACIPQNPGLKRRFNPDDAFMFDDFEDRDLLRIMKRAARKAGLRLPVMVAREAIAHLSKKRSMPNFGNAGAVNSMLTAAKLRRAARLQSANRGSRNTQSHDAGETKEESSHCQLSTGAAAHSQSLTIEDLVGEEETSRALSNPFAKLGRLKNADKIVSQLQDIATALAVWRREGGERPEIGNCVFVGNAGTGKVSVGSLQYVEYVDVSVCFTRARCPIKMNAIAAHVLN